MKPGDDSIGVLVVDDHPLVLQGILKMIHMQSDMMVVAQAVNGTEAIAAFREHRPDVVLMDLMLPDLSGTEVVRQIVGEFPGARILMLSSSEGDADIYRALEVGAWGYLLKGTSHKDLVEGIRSAHIGQKRLDPVVATKLAEYLAAGGLSSREIDVLSLVADGYSNKRIADKLFIAEDTAKMHVKNIMGKLNASDRTQAVTIALRRGILHLK